MTFVDKGLICVVYIEVKPSLLSDRYLKTNIG